MKKYRWYNRRFPYLRMLSGMLIRIIVLVLALLMVGCLASDLALLYWGEEVPCLCIMT